MALQPRNLFEDLSGTDKVPSRRYIRLSARPRPVKAIAGAPLLPMNTPMAQNTVTGFWEPFVQGGADGTAVIRAFLLCDHQSSAAGETVAELVFAMEIHRNDINTAAIRAVLGGGATEAQLDTALGASLLRELDFYIQGLVPPQA